MSALDKWEFIFKKEVSSTQILAKELLNQGKTPIPFVVIAERQTDGYGRYSRKWYSPTGGLWCSIVVNKEEIPFKKTAHLFIIVGISVFQTIQLIYKIKPTIKWPNDILVNNKKVAGIIIEEHTTNRKGYFIIGIGVNINNKVPLEINDTAISLKDITGEECEIRSFLFELIMQFKKDYTIYTKNGIENFIAVYVVNNCLMDKKVVIKLNGETKTGTVKGFDMDGNLVLSVDGIEEKLSSGTVLSY